METDLSELFSLDVPLLAIFIRGTCMYLGVFAILRVVLKREVGQVGIPDLLMITILADAAQNGLAGEYRSITAGLLLVLTVVFWNFLLDFLGARFALIERILSAPPLRLVERGRIKYENLKTASMSRDELFEHLREKGIEKVEGLRAVYLEGNGTISVIK